ncbi:MAG: major intrinsic protein [Candidatus Peregrinibacteria bacterium Greene0416_19]|nr:MAG: major intrinsic protein [Candidatus Peregrinibacteria bacterium Greene0416_19]
MVLRKVAAEFIGAFILAFAVALSVGFNMSFPTPVLAGITLGLFVYTVGGLSGAHLNPAVTVALLTARKVKANEAGLYIVAQLLAGWIAFMLAKQAGAELTGLSSGGNVVVGLFEALGTFILAFGIASVVHSQTPAAAAGLVIGGSLTLGAFMASAVSAGAVNPAVAVGLGSVDPIYLLSPVVGAIAGVWTFEVLWNAKGRR